MNKPATYCEIDTKEKAPMAEVLPLHHYMTHPELWNRILEAKTKAEVIGALTDFCASQGVFAGSDREVRDKLLKMRG